VNSRDCFNLDRFDADGGILNARAILSGRIWRHEETP
jgi:hypothetical protein